MLNSKTNLQRIIQMLSIITIAALSSTCGSDDSSTNRPDPNNCSTPCLASAPDLDKTSVVNSSGDTVIMILHIAGNTADIDLNKSSFSLDNVANALAGAGTLTLVTSTNAVVSTEFNTITMNFEIPTNSIIGTSWYPAIQIGVADSPDPNDPGQPAPNFVGYTLQVSTSSVNYSYEEVIAGEGSIYTYTFTDHVIPIVEIVSGI